MELYIQGHIRPLQRPVATQSRYQFLSLYAPRQYRTRYPSFPDLPPSRTSCIPKREYGRERGRRLVRAGSRIAVSRHFEAFQRSCPTEGSESVIHNTRKDLTYSRSGCSSPGLLLPQDRSSSVWKLSHLMVRIQMEFRWHARMRQSDHQFGRLPSQSASLRSPARRFTADALVGLPQCGKQVDLITEAAALATTLGGRSGLPQKVVTLGMCIAGKEWKIIATASSSHDLELGTAYVSKPTTDTLDRTIDISSSFAVSQRDLRWRLAGRSRKVHRSGHCDARA